MTQTKTTAEGQTTCRFPSFGRPPDPETEPLAVCREHWEGMEASSAAEAWEFALNILGPWVEATRAIGHPELEQVMEKALGEAKEAADRAREELKRAEAALAREGGPPTGEAQPESGGEEVRRNSA